MKKLILASALFLFVLAGIFPPWIKTVDLNGPNGSHSRKPVGVYFILSPPQVYEEGQGMRIDFTQLFVEWGVILVIGTSPVWFKKLATSQAGTK